MPTNYPSLQALHQAYASEPERTANTWTYWSEQHLADDSLEVTITLANGITDVWRKEPGGSTLTLQQT